ncbi:MAG: FAD-dependent oxidoreductase [Deltaproteobacteria bacterium]
MGQTTKYPRVLIIGGGFAGVNTVLNLKKLHTKLDVKLISDKYSHDYKARIFKIIEDSDSSSVQIPLNDIIGEKNCFIDTVTEINLKEHLVKAKSKKEYSYDYLIIASGSQVNFHNVTVINDMTFSVNSSKEADLLRKHIEKTISSIKKAREEEKISLGHIVIVGGGATGVEIAAALTKSTKKLAEKYGIDKSMITIDLFHSGPRLLNKLKPQVSQAVEKRLRLLGVNIFYNRRLQKEHLENITLGDLHIKAETIIWTAGIKPNKLIPYSDKSITDYLTLKNHPEVYIIGDASKDEYYGMAQTALEHSKYISKSISQKINNQKIEPYKSKPVYYAVPVLSGWAAVQTRHFVFTGWIGWLIRRFIDFRYLVNRLSLESRGN